MIIITQEIFEGLEACRTSGYCNMFHVSCVLRWLNIHEYYAAVIWVNDNKEDYLDGCLKGFEVK